MFILPMELKHHAHLSRTIWDLKGGVSLDCREQRYLRGRQGKSRLPSRTYCFSRISDNITGKNIGGAKMKFILLLTLPRIKGAEKYNSIPLLGRLKESTK